MASRSLKFLNQRHMSHKLCTALALCRSKLGTARLTTISGIAILTAGFAVLRNQPLAIPTRLAGLVVLGVALMLIAKPHIKSREQPSFRRLLWTAWYLAGAGLLLLAIAAITSVS